MAENKIIDIKIGGIERKRYRINGNDNKIIELNPSDFNITVRMNEAYPKLKDCESKISELSNVKDSQDEISEFSKKLSKLDSEMRSLTDYIFDAEVSDICCDGGSMYDLIDGYMRYEIIFNTLVSLYEKNLAVETKKIQKRVKQHTDKYIKK